MLTPRGGLFRFNRVIYARQSHQLSQVVRPGAIYYVLVRFWDEHRVDTLHLLVCKWLSLGPISGLDARC
jgi:hypothetical protein